MKRVLQPLTLAPRSHHPLPGGAGSAGLTPQRLRRCSSWSHGACADAQRGTRHTARRSPILLPSPGAPGGQGPVLFTPVSPLPSAAAAQGRCSANTCRDGADAPRSAVCPQLRSHRCLRKREEGTQVCGRPRGLSCPSALTGVYLQTVRSCSLFQGMAQRSQRSFSP